MSKLEMLQPDGVAAPGAHYSTATRVGDRLYVAGLVAADVDGTILGQGSVREQAVHTCRTLEKICRQYGADLGSVAQCTQYVTDVAHYREADAGFAEVFGEHRPARATVVVELVHPDWLYELISIVEL